MQHSARARETEVPMMTMASIMKVIAMVGVMVIPATALHPHTHLPTQDLIRVRGYPAEVHHVVTEDGYILEMHRIPYGRPKQQYNIPLHQSSEQYSISLEQSSEHNTSHHQLIIQYLTSKDESSRDQMSTVGGKNTDCDGDDKGYEEDCGRDGSHRRVVFVQHCVLCSSADFVMNDPDQALGFMLADAGYDVWFGNARGNRYSRKHVSLSPDDPKFWDFSWDKIAKYDIPTMLTYVREMTRVKQVYYVGHSMGTSVFFVMMHYHPHINSWIRVMAGMAPVAYMHNKNNPLHALAPFATHLDRVLTKMGFQELFQSTSGLQSFGSSLCSPDSFTRFICSCLHSLIAGPNSNYVDQEYLPVITAHNPAGSSIHVITHFLQIVHARKFQAFDYGSEMNLKLYGSTFPEEFSLRAVTAPVGVFWSVNDWVADPADVQQTVSELPNVVYNHRVALEDFNHLDFLWAENAQYLVYDKVLKLLSKYH